MSLWITLGRAGDVLIALQMVYHEYQKTGHKQDFMVSEAYAGILDGVSYVNPIVFEGEFTDLHNAHKQALTITKKPILSQVCGPKNVLDRLVYGGKFDRQADSFEREMWRVAGRMDLWRFNLPLVFDQRNKKREKDLWESVSDSWNYKRKTQPTILVSMSGISSPFQYKELLMELLTKRFNVGHHIVDISDIRAERLYDMLTFIEKAHCLICTDSALLHLAHAANTPVCALIADTPQLWHGSAWRPNHVSYVRYSNFPRDYQNMMDAIANIGQPGSAF